MTIKSPWKRSLTKNAKRDLDLEVALRDVAVKNQVLIHLLTWVEAHLERKTPHEEILEALTARMSVHARTADVEAQ